MVAQSIPLSLGDSYGGFRIVGSNTDFLSLYGAPVAEGRLWERPYEAIIGANVARETGLEVNQLFAGTHGLSEQGQAHEDVPYKVVGLITSPTLPGQSDCHLPRKCLDDARSCRA